jgi:hypothetical protein
VDLVGSVPVTKLVDQRAADEARGAGDQDLHRGRVYWRACVLLAAVLLGGGCDHGKRRVSPPPPPPRQSYLALDREQRRIVHDYQPASAALTEYELAFRDWRLGRLQQAELLRRARSYRVVVRRALSRVRSDAATAETTRAKRLLVEALQARAAALAALPALGEYRPRWDRSVVKARAGLSVLQDIRDRARLIPLPEDSVS